MNDHITSNNQKGGITAGSVNITSAQQSNYVNDSSKKGLMYNPWVITIVGGTIVALVSSMTWFNIPLLS